MENDGTIRNIVKEILRECTNKSLLQIHENFLNYYVKLIALDPKWGVSSNFLTNRQDVQNFIKYVVATLQDQKAPNIVTLKMQFYFSCNYDNKWKMVHRNREDLVKRLEPLKNEIIATGPTDNDDPSVIYKKLIFFIALTSGTGNPTIDPVYREVSAALKSIMNESELCEFLAENRRAKIEQLDDSVKIVTGIRLFNKDCDKGGEGIEELPKLLNEALDATQDDLQETLVNIMDKVNMMTTALDQIYVIEEDERGDYQIACNIPDSVEVEDVDFIKDCLVVYRQYELFVRKLIGEVERIEENSTRIYQHLQTTLLDLHRTIKSRIAIPVAQVFPGFKKLCEIWTQLQDETILLSKLTQILTNLGLYVKQVNYNQSLIEMLCGSDPPMTDAERLELTTGLEISPVGNKAEILNLSSLSSIEKLHLQYLGFCGWKLVQTGGGLLPGNPNMGVAKVMNMYYAFSTLEAASAFGKAPEKYVLETINMARNKPELINFLQLKDQLDLLQEIKQLVMHPPMGTMTYVGEMQTDTHAVDSFIDPKYKWNIWDLKREAIMLANLSKCKTVSVQTTKSYARGGVRTQTYFKKEQNDQTKRDNYSNVPKPSTFIFGLRGRKDDKQFIVDLTRPKNE